MSLVPRALDPRPSDPSAVSAGDGARRVPEERALRAWLRRESIDPSASDGGGTEARSRPALLDGLLTAKPGAASFLARDGTARWYRLAVDRERFGALRPIEGPESLHWRRLSVDGTLLGVASRLRRDPDAVESVGGVDPERVRAYRDALAAGERLDPLIVRSRRGDAPWVVADGNHRAAAVGLRLLETGEFDPPEAYLAVLPNPVLRPVAERARGLARRLLALATGGTPPPGL